MRIAMLTIWFAHLAFVGLAQNQAFVPFSPFDSSLANFPNFSVAKTGSGFLLYLTPPYSPDFQQQYVYALDENGNLVQALELPFPSRHIGFLFNSEGKHYFFGQRRAPDSSPLGADKRVLYEISADAQLLNTVVWDGVSPTTGGFAPLSFLGVGLQSINYGSAKVEDKTLYAIMNYLVLQAPQPGDPQGQFAQFEKLGLDGSVQTIVNLQSVNGFYSYADFTEDQIFLFGTNNGPNYPGTVGSGYGGVARFDLDGNLLGVLSYDDPEVGRFTPGSCMYHNGQFYCNQYEFTANYPGSPVCPDGQNVLIEIRDKDFGRLKGRSLPDCGYEYAVAGRSFAFDDQGNIYYANFRGDKGLTVFKFDPDLNILWEVSAPSAFVGFLEGTADGGVLIGTYERTGTLNDLLRIFRISPAGLLSEQSVFSTGQMPALALVPNPAADFVQCPQLIGEDVFVEAINAQGRLCLSVRTNDGRINLRDQAPGVYTLRFSDARTGHLIGTQKLIRQ